jgi:hypothetical protein
MVVRNSALGAAVCDVIREAHEKAAELDRINIRLRNERTRQSLFVNPRWRLSPIPEWMQDYRG